MQGFWRLELASGWEMAEKFRHSQFVAALGRGGWVLGCISACSLAAIRGACGVMAIPPADGGSPPDSSSAAHSSPERADGFGPTQWSVVIAAGRADGGSREALEKLCSTYWRPSFWYFRRQGRSQEEAEDLAQDFFQMLLATESLAAVNPERGRFRSWLLGALKHFFLNDLRSRRALKRGGGREMLSLDALPVESMGDSGLTDGDSPEAAFDKKWAQTVVAKARSRLEREYALAGQADRFAALQQYQAGSEPAASYAAAAAQLSITEEAAKSAIYKLRQRFGRLLRNIVAQTVADPAEVEDELRFLVTALRG